MQEYEYLARVVNNHKGCFREATYEEEVSNFEFSSRAKMSLRELILRENPKGEEAFFCGVGEGFFVKKVYTQKFPGGPGFYFTKEGIIESSLTLKDKLNFLAEIAESGCGRDTVLFLGHLHPSGMIDCKGKQVLLPPSEALLFPSSEDLLAMRNDSRKYSLRYEAIAANTEKGPCVRIFSLKFPLLWSIRKQLTYATVNLNL